MKPTIRVLLGLLGLLASCQNSGNIPAEVQDHPDAPLPALVQHSHKLQWVQGEFQWVCEKPGGEAFYLRPRPEEYIVKPGDNLLKIAQRFNLTYETILSVNQIRKPRSLMPGTRIKIPFTDGQQIAVSGTPVSLVAQEYQICEYELRQVNRLDPQTQLVQGTLFIPGAQMSLDERMNLLGDGYVWPTTGGKISSYFGYRQDPIYGYASVHWAVDIANKPGAPVYALASGRVVGLENGWLLGNHITIQHEGGLQSIYGHLSGYAIKLGQTVKSGQLIGFVGSTGYSTGPHLHFELRRWGRLVDPISLFS